jgi:hypothetical protein
MSHRQRLLLLCMVVFSGLSSSVALAAEHVRF